MYNLKKINKKIKGHLKIICIICIYFEKEEFSTDRDELELKMMIITIVVEIALAENIFLLKKPYNYCIKYFHITF